MEPIELPKSGATGAILDGVFKSMLEHHAVEIALKSFIEGKGLEGDWQLDLTARLVPTPPKPIEQEQQHADARELVRTHFDGDNPL